MKFSFIFSVFLCVLQSCNTDRTAENGRLNLVAASFSEVQLPLKQKDIQLKSVHLNYPNLTSKRFNEWILHMLVKAYCVFRSSSK